MSNTLKFYGNKANITKETEDAIENIANSKEGQKAIENEGRLLMYEQGAQMLADMGFIEQKEVQNFAREAMEQSGEDIEDSQEDE